VHSELERLGPAERLMLTVASLGAAGYQYACPSAMTPGRLVMSAPARGCKACLLQPAEPAQPALQIMALPPPPRPMLSDASVSRIIEMVWRDTRKVLAEFRFEDLSQEASSLFLRGFRAEAKATPLFADLVRDRLPILRWYVRHKSDQARLACCDWLEGTGISPRSADDFQRCRSQLRSCLDEQKAELWPTLRALLLTERIHRRVVRAAQAQLWLASQAQSQLIPSSSLAVNILTSPRRLVLLWLAGLKAMHYGLRWVFNEFGLKWVLSPEQRRRVRAKLIERAILKGLELQRRVESIEEALARGGEGDAPGVPHGDGSPALLAGTGGSTYGASDQATIEAARFARWLQRG
jgi:hypothetical protein